MLRPRLLRSLQRLPKRRALSNFSDLWSWRQRAVMRNHDLTSKVGLAFGHCGYIMGLLEYGVTDIVLLRLFAIGCAGFVVGYQMLQPRVQWMTAGWCGLYVAVNIYQLAQLLKAPAPVLTWEEAQLHSLLGNIALAELAPLLALGDWLWLVDGALLAEEEEPAGGCLYFLLQGRCALCLGGEELASLGPGDVVGEASVLRGAERREMTVRAAGSVRCFAVAAEDVRALVEERPNLRPPLVRVLSDSLARKLSRLGAGLQERKYRAALELACGLAGTPRLASGLARLRHLYGIGEEQHARLLEELPQCGRAALGGDSGAAP